MIPLLGKGVFIMVKFEIDGTEVTCPDDMSLEEAEVYQKECIDSKHELVELEIKLDDGEVELHPHYNTVKRVRRITGYLSNVENFNAAKKAEARDRVVHY